MSDLSDYYAARDEELLAEDPEFVKAESRRQLGLGDYDIDDDGNIIPKIKKAE